MLVGLSNSPSAYDPVRNPDASLEKRNDVLHSMYEVGYLTKEDYDSFSAQPLHIVQEEAEGTDENYQSSYAMHCAALTLMALDGFEFRYTFEDKDDYTDYMDQYQPLYTEKATTSVPAATGSIQPLILICSRSCRNSLTAACPASPSSRTMANMHCRELPSWWTTRRIMWWQWSAAAARRIPSTVHI